MKIIKTTKICCALIAVATVLTASNALATVGTITLNYDYGNANGGGTFTAVTTGGLGTFDTFCLAEGVLFHTGTTYNYSTSASAIPGGPGNGGAPDPISIGTAYLYSQFRAGTLTGYTYGNATSANNLQAAIWWLEGENLGVKNGFVTLAESILTLNDTTILADANGAFGVIVLNLTDAAGNYYQSQLGAVPEPSTVVAGALLLLPFGVSTMRILRKNKAA